MKKNVILIGGWGSNKKSWQTLQYKISNNFIFYYYGWEEYLKNKNSLTDLLNKQKSAILIGWSLGGLIALESALANTSKIEKLVLLAATARMPKDKNYIGVNPKTLKSMTSKLAAKREELIRDFATNCFYPQPPDPLFKAASKNFTDKELTTGLEFLNNSDLRAELKKINIPTLIIHGTKDKIMPLRQSDYLAKVLPNNSFKTLALGHALPFYQSKELLTAVESFINE